MFNLSLLAFTTGPCFRSLIETTYRHMREIELQFSANPGCTAVKRSAQQSPPSLVMSSSDDESDSFASRPSKIPKRARLPRACDACRRKKGEIHSIVPFSGADGSDLCDATKVKCEDTFAFPPTFSLLTHIEIMPRRWFVRTERSMFELYYKQSRLQLHRCKSCTLFLSSLLEHAEGISPLVET